MNVETIYNLHVVLELYVMELYNYP